MAPFFGTPCTLVTSSKISDSLVMVFMWETCLLVASCMLMIVLLSGCCNGLHSMTDICGDYRKQFDIRFNPLESQTACFGGNPPSHFPLVLNGMTIPITKKLNTLVCILTVKPIPRTQPRPSENFLEVLITSCLFLSLQEMKCWQYTWSKHTACQCYYMAVKHGNYHPVKNTS